MTDLIAKPIIKNQYWVITDGTKKVGNVVASHNGFEVKIAGGNLHFASTEEVKKKTKIQFEPLKTNRTKPNLPYPEYPTSDNIYNSILDIQRKLHLFTETADSKCYHAAGWFVVNHNGTNEVVFCPKYIFIQRYDYHGPFKTKSEADKMLNT
jgi:hypothetical protein